MNLTEINGEHHTHFYQDPKESKKELDRDSLFRLLKRVEFLVNKKFGKPYLDDGLVVFVLHYNPHSGMICIESDNVISSPFVFKYREAAFEFIEQATEQNIIKFFKAL